MQKRGNVISAILSVILGVMLIVMKGEVISLVLNILGWAVVIAGIVDVVNKLTTPGLVKMVIGGCILIFGGLFVNLALYILAAGIIIMGIMQIAEVHRFEPIVLTAKEKMLAYLKPVVTVIAGVFLLFNQGGAIDWIFIVVGILLVVEGVLNLFEIRK